ncbi:hypothetical protein NGUA15_04310 [Salmonella enterica]|nr:hypothetical protein NGUA15_04310 [Salmonella enterica]
MPEDGGAQIKTPAQWINLPPVVGKIGFDFTFFLIYARQAAKNLPDQMLLRATQRYAGAQRRHCPVIGDAQPLIVCPHAIAQL